MKLDINNTYDIKLDDTIDAKILIESEDALSYFGSLSCIDPLRYFGVSINKKTGYIIDIFGNYCGKFNMEQLCTCGGYTTYKNYFSEFHSPFCKVNNG